MKVRARFVAVLFGPGGRSGDLVAPGDADCRWRAAAALGRAAAVNDETALPDDLPPPPDAESDVRVDRD